MYKRSAQQSSIQLKTTLSAKNLKRILPLKEGTVTSMDIKMFCLCLSLLAVAVSASFAPNPKDSVAKYNLKLSKNGQDFDGKIEINTQTETETFHVPKVSADEEAADIVYDFKRGWTMIRLRDAKSCFLSNSTDDVPKPTDLVQLLDNSNSNGVTIGRSENAVNLTVVGTLEADSATLELGDEMKDLCAKLPIYIVAEGDVDQTPDDAVDQTSVKLPSKRVKRGWGRVRIRVRTALRWVCRNVCTYKCYKVCGLICYTVCRRPCSRVCSWIG